MDIHGDSAFLHYRWWTSLFNDVGAIKMMNETTPQIIVDEKDQAPPGTVEITPNEKQLLRMVPAKDRTKVLSLSRYIQRIKKDTRIPRQVRRDPRIMLLLSEAFEFGYDLGESMTMVKVEEAAAKKSQEAQNGEA